MLRHSADDSCGNQKMHPFRGPTQFIIQLRALQASSFYSGPLLNYKKRAKLAGRMRSFLRFSINIQQHLKCCANLFLVFPFLVCLEFGME